MFIIFDYIKSNLIAFLALIISFISLIISLTNTFKEVVRLKITYNMDEALCVGFMYYQPYKIIFLDINIENKSKSEVTISSITLSNSDECYSASLYDISDRHNENGLTLYSKDKFNSGYFYNLKSENIMNNPRLRSNDHIDGYVVFFDVNLITKDTEYKLTVHTPNNKFSIPVIVKPIPPDMKPLNELNS